MSLMFLNVNKNFPLVSFTVFLCESYFCNFSITHVDKVTSLVPFSFSFGFEKYSVQCAVGIHFCLNSSENEFFFFFYCLSTRYVLNNSFQ